MSPLLAPLRRGARDDLETQLILTPLFANTARCNLRFLLTTKTYILA